MNKIFAIISLSVIPLVLSGCFYQDVKPYNKTEIAILKAKIFNLKYELQICQIT